MIPVGESEASPQLRCIRGFNEGAPWHSRMREIRRTACPHEVPYASSPPSKWRNFLATRAGSSAGGTWLLAFSLGPNFLEPFSLKPWPGSGVGKAVWSFSQIQYPLEPKPISLAQGPVIEALALFSNPCGSIAVRGRPVNAQTT